MLLFTKCNLRTIKYLWVSCTSTTYAMCAEEYRVGIQLCGPSHWDNAHHTINVSCETKWIDVSFPSHCTDSNRSKWYSPSNNTATSLTSFQLYCWHINRNMKMCAETIFILFIFGSFKRHFEWRFSGWPWPYITYNQCGSFAYPPPQFHFHSTQSTRTLGTKEFNGQNFSNKSCIINNNIRHFERTHKRTLAVNSTGVQKSHEQKKKKANAVDEVEIYSLFSHEH